MSLPPTPQQYHGGSGSGPTIPGPTHDPEPATSRTPAEEARTLVESVRAGALASLSDDGTPWASVVTYGATATGEPVLVLSTMAEHGRNLAREAACSIVVAEPVEDDADPLDRARVTLAGRAYVPEGEAAEAALDAHAKNFPSARGYSQYGDFTMYVLGIERVRWVGGFARMASVEAADYAVAEPDPTWAGQAAARTHLNEDHREALLLWARTLGGYSDAAIATCESIDRYGVDLRVITPRGEAPVRVGFAEPARSAGDLRGATVELVARAKASEDSGATSHH